MAPAAREPRIGVACDPRFPGRRGIEQKRKTAPTRQCDGGLVVLVLAARSAGVGQGWRERQQPVDGSRVLGVDVRHPLEQVAEVGKRVQFVCVHR